MVAAVLDIPSLTNETAMSKGCMWEILQFIYSLILAYSFNSDYMEANYVMVKFEVFTAVTMKNAVSWDVPPCGCCKNRRFRGI
jgi:hypothetical protein